MKLPRDVSGDDLAVALRVMGYAIKRQTGSHLRLTCQQPTEHHVTIPRHNPLRIGTLAAILAEVAAFHQLNRDLLITMLFAKPGE